jgi:hypothetical protein
MGNSTRGGGAVGGTTFNWTATASSRRTAGSNWSPDGPPAAANTAIVPVGSIQINSGTVAITGRPPGGSLNGPTTGKGNISVVARGELPVSDALEVWGALTAGVDAASLVDIGTSGSASAGSVLANNGHSLAGDAVIVAAVVNNGAIDATHTCALASSTGGRPPAERVHWRRHAAALFGLWRRVVQGAGHRRTGEAGNRSRFRVSARGQSRPTTLPMQVSERVSQ